MVSSRRKSMLPVRTQVELIKSFVGGSTARSPADLTGVNRHTATLCFHKLRELIALRLSEEDALIDGEIEVDESYVVGHCCRCSPRAVPMTSAFRQTPDHGFSDRLGSADRVMRFALKGFGEIIGCGDSKGCALQLAVTKPVRSFPGIMEQVPQRKDHDW